MPKERSNCPKPNPSRTSNASRKIAVHLTLPCRMETGRGLIFNLPSSVPSLICSGGSLTQLSSPLASLRHLTLLRCEKPCSKKQPTASAERVSSCQVVCWLSYRLTSCPLGAPQMLTGQQLPSEGTVPGCGGLGAGTPVMPKAVTATAGPR